MNDVKKRDSNLEILRLISMFIIVAHHYSIHGFANSNLYFSFNKYIVDILSLGGKIGVICFILISGFFMVNSKFTIKKLWKLVGEVFFYSFGFLILFSSVLKPVNLIEEKDINKSIFPICYSAYWFMTCYVVLMILSPYINKFIRCMKKGEIEKFIVLMICMWSIASTFFEANLSFNQLGWFIVIYIIAAYIRLYVKLDNKAIKINKRVLIISVALLIFSPIFYNTLGKVTGVTEYMDKSRNLSSISSVLAVVISVTMFLYFLNRKRYSSNFINNIAKCTLGVYLIHDNFLFRPYLWEKILKNTNFYSSKLLILHAIGSIVLVYVVCIIIDYVRIKLIEPIWMKLYDYLENKFKKSDEKVKLLGKSS